MAENGNGRIHLLNDHRAPVGPKTDDQGRVLKHSASIADVHQIASEESNRVNRFYAEQFPPYMARMITDALLHYGLIKPEQIGVPQGAEAPAETPVENGGVGEAGGVLNVDSVPGTSEGPE